jgi:hypothetical protein
MEPMYYVSYYLELQRQLAPRRNRSRSHYLMCPPIRSGARSDQIKLRSMLVQSNAVGTGHGVGGGYPDASRDGYSFQ